MHAPPIIIATPENETDPGRTAPPSATVGSMAMTTATDVFHLSVQGVPFAIEASLLDTIKSDFLSTLLANGSAFASSADPEGVFAIDAVDPEAFSAILHLSRFGSLSVTSDDDVLVTAADFLGQSVSVRVNAAMEDRAGRLRAALDHGVASLAPRIEYIADGYIKECNAFLLSKQHHNFREDDGHGRVYCTDCRNRDFDSRFYAAGSGNAILGYKREGCDYAPCKRCGTMMEYKPDLGWCHKCQLCRRCQSCECPCDGQLGMHASPKQKPDPGNVSRTLRKIVTAMGATQLGC